MLILLKFLSSYLLIYSVGTVIYRLIIKASFIGYSRLFVKLLIGLFSIITVYSIIKTSGITINTGLILILVFIIFSCRIKNWPINKTGFKENELQDLKLILYSLPIMVIFVGWRYFYLFSSETEIPVSYLSDTLNHCIRALFINQTGIESGNVNYYFLPDGVEPYHYFEAWAVAVFGSLLNLNFWVAAQIIIIPLFNMIIVTGVIGIAEKWTKNYLVFLICIGSVFFGAYYFEQLETIKYLKHTYSFGSNAFDEYWVMKLSIVYIIILMFIHVISDNKNFVAGLIILLSLPILSITLAPTILTLVTIVSFILVIFQKKLKIKIPFYIIFYPFIVGLYLLLFYKIFGPTEEFIEKPGLHILMDLKSFDIIKHRIFVGLEKILQMFVLYTPYIITVFLLFFYKHFKIKSFFTDQRLFIIIIFFIIGIPGSILLWMIFFNLFGGSQFFFYTMLPFLNIISFLVLIYGLVKISFKPIKYSIAIVIIISFFLFFTRSYNIYDNFRSSWFDKYSIEYINETTREISFLENKKGLKLEHPQELSKFNDASSFISGFVFGGVEGSNLTSITMGEMYHNKMFPTQEAEMFLKKAPFSIYIDKLTKEGKFVDLISTMLSFIKEYKIQFIFVSSYREIPVEMMTITQELITDSKSGEKLLIFKR